jgi:hypothetical protein
MAEASRNNSTAAQLTAPAAADERDIEPQSDHWRQTCHWRLARILRFAERQKKQRAWISFSELAERYGRNIGITEGYEQLKRAVINGEFERNGRSRVLYLHPAVTIAKMTRERMRNAVETYPLETVRRHYLAPCWIPRELADAWEKPSYEPWRQEPQLTERPKRKHKGHKQPKRVRVRAILHQIFSSGIPPESELSNKELLRLFDEQLKKPELKTTLHAHDRTVLRAAGRSK